MNCQVSKEIIGLYKDNKLDMEVSLAWILGYVEDGNMKQIAFQKGAFCGSPFEEVSIRADIITRIKISREEDVFEAVNLLLFCAFVLGGGE